MQMPLSERCVGRWRGVLPRLGIDPAFLTGKHSGCPTCGGKDRFRFDDKQGRGTWICSNCGAGDGVGLVMRVKGWDFRRAAREIEQLVDGVPVNVPKAEQTDGDKREAMNRLWLASKRVTSGDAVSLYIKTRLGLNAPPDALRCASNVRYQDHGGSSLHPAMLAMVTDATGQPANVHRTYLTGHGQKADVPTVRKMMPGPVPKGSAIRLWPAVETLGIAEGIETAIAASHLFGVPVWAVVNAFNMASWLPPESVRSVIVFADNDPAFAGQAAAFAAAQRIVGQTSAQVEVRFPTSVGQDWADVLQHQRTTADACTRGTE